MTGSLDGIETALDQLESTLQDCRAEIVLGGRVDLAGLDKRVDGLCQNLLAAKPASQRLLPRLDGLVAELDALHAALKAQAGRQ
jgi:hypothetical protein